MLNRPRIARLPLLLAASLLVVLPCPPAGAAEPHFQTDGAAVRVVTDRYEAVIRAGCLIGLTNRLTGETHARPANDQASMDRLPSGLGVRPAGASDEQVKALGAIHGWWGEFDPAAAASLIHRAPPDCVPTLERLGVGQARLTWRGLVGADPNRRHDDEQIVWDLHVLPGCGDLEITARGRSASSDVFGVAVGMLNFSRGLNWILPIVEGFEFRPAEEDADSNVHTAQWPWPWTASLVIAEGKRGSVGLWMTDPSLRPRQLFYRNSADGFDVGFLSDNHAPVDKLREAVSRTIRINCYAGNWVHAARPFRDNWEKVHHVRPLAEREPNWLRECYGVINGIYGVPAEQDRRSVIAFAPQRWKVGPAIGDGGLFPYDIEAGPQLNMLARFAEQLRDPNVHVMVYLNISHMNQGHPWAGKFWDHRLTPPFEAIPQNVEPEANSPRSFVMDCAYRPWQDLIVGWARQSYERFGIRGFYMDCAVGHANTATGLIDGKNDCQGTVELMRRLKQAVPGAFLSCEYLNEVTAQVVDLGMFGKDHWWGGSAGRRESRVHPLGGFLFNRYAHMHRGYNPVYHETLGKLAWPAPVKVAEGDVADYASFVNWWDYFYELQRRTGMRPYYPDRWDANVRSYFRDANGLVYKVYSEIRPEGRMVRVQPDGSEELVYWRIKGRTTAKIRPGTGIEGWIAYNGDTAIGLNPDAEYLYVGGPRIDDWRITALPDKTFIRRARPYKDGTLVLELGSLDGNEHKGPFVLHRPKYPLAFTITGCMNAVLPPIPSQAPPISYGVDALAPGVVVIGSAKPLHLTLPADGNVLADLAKEMKHAAYLTPSGLRTVMKKGSKPVVRDGNRIAMHYSGWALVDYVLALPKVPAGKRIVFEVTAAMPREAANFVGVVLVNGQLVAEHQTEGLKDYPPMRIDLTDHAGKAILLSFGIREGRLFRHGEFRNPRIVVLPTDR